MRKKCLERLARAIVISFDADGYRRFSGEVNMAYHLGLITEEEKWKWLDRAAEGMRNAR